MNQMGIGMSVTMLPAILQIKNNFPNEIWAESQANKIKKLEHAN